MENLTFQNKSVKELFDRSLTSYESLFGSSRSADVHCFRTRASIAGILAQGSKGTYLDCAVGSGDVACSILSTASFTDVTIVDISPKMLSLAAGKIKLASTGNISQTESDIFDFFAHHKSSREQGYDLIACLGLIAHTGRLEELLILMRGALAPGGRILLQATLAEHWGIALHRRLTARRYLKSHGYAISYYSSSQVRRELLRAGFEIVDIRKFCIGIPFLDLIWPPMGYYVERLFEPISKFYGSEEIYLIQKAL